MSLISVKGDTPETEALKKTLPNYQYIAVRDAQIYMEARIIEKRGDDVLVEYPAPVSSRALIGPDGERVWLKDE
jgi:hypothetical protein